MDSRKLPRTEWKAYFDVMSHALAGGTAEIEVAGLDLGDQIEGEWITLAGIAYDKKDDTLYVYAAQLAHAIRSPREINVVDAGLAIATVAVRDAEGHLQIVKLRGPLLLPPPPRLDGGHPSHPGA